MFFLIGGVSPRLRRVYEPSKRIFDALRREPTGFCSPCNQVMPRAAFRQDYWLNLFFLPLMQVRTGEEFIGCEECGAPCSKAVETSACASCRGPMGPLMKFCPECGARLLNH